MVSEKITTLMNSLSQKEEEINFYKARLKELETAFCHNLEIISERDAELTTLENQITHGNEQLQQLAHERDELEEILKTVDKTNKRKIQQLEGKLSLKEDEVKALQMENARNINKLQRVSKDFKEREWKKINEMNAQFENDKKILKECHREEMDEKEKYYLLEIDNLSKKLEEVVQENSEYKKVEQENKKLKNHLVNMDKLLRKSKYITENPSRRRLGVNRETQCLVDEEKTSKAQSCMNQKIQCQIDEEETSNTNPSVNQEIQCQIDEEVSTNDAGIQSEQIERKSSESQTGPLIVSNANNQLKKKLLILQEQNEIMKYVIKDLKKNNDTSAAPYDCNSRQVCAECASTKLEVRAVHDKFEIEISNLKKLLLDEQKQRAEEEAVLQGLETTMCCLKGKVLAGLQSSSGNFAEDKCKYRYDDSMKNKLQVAYLEQSLNHRIDALLSETQLERKKVNEKIDAIKSECLEKIENSLKFDSRNETLLEKIRSEIVSLEKKIETDMENVIRKYELDKIRKREPASQKRNGGGGGSSSNNLLPEIGCSGEVEVPYEYSPLPPPTNICLTNSSSTGKCVGTRTVPKVQSQRYGRKGFGDSPILRKYSNVPSR